MRKFLFAGALSLAVSAYAPTAVDAGERCRPVRTAVANLVERWKARTVRVARFACEVAATVRPVVTLNFEKSRPTLAFSYQFAGRSARANGRCTNE